MQSSNFFFIISESVFQELGVAEDSSEILIKIADLGNACWTVSFCLLCTLNSLHIIFSITVQTFLRRYSD